MRYKNTPYLNDYEAETRRWHIKRTEQLNDDLDCGQSITEFIRPSAMRLRKSFEHALKRSGFDGGTE